nr:hypothetical protein [Gemmatimonadaceae bacterium]
MIDRNTPWRGVGDVPMEIWSRTIDGAGGPEGLVRPEAWASARPHSALALAQLAKESRYGTDWDANSVNSKNALNLKDRINGGYVQAATWEAGVAAWRERITSPTYPNGLALYAETTTLAEYVYVFAPPNDQTKTTTEAYLNALISLINGWGPVSV